MNTEKLSVYLEGILKPIRSTPLSIKLRRWGLSREVFKTLMEAMREGKKVPIKGRYHFAVHAHLPTRTS